MALYGSSYGGYTYATTPYAFNFLTPSGVLISFNEVIHSSEWFSTLLDGPIWAANSPSSTTWTATDVSIGSNPWTAQP